MTSSIKGIDKMKRSLNKSTTKTSVKVHTTRHKNKWTAAVTWGGLGGATMDPKVREI